MTFHFNDRTTEEFVYKLDYYVACYSACCLLLLPASACCSSKAATASRSVPAEILLAYRHIIKVTRLLRTPVAPVRYGSGKQLCDIIAQFRSYVTVV